MTPSRRIQRKAANIDEKVFGTAWGHVGPFQQRLASFGQLIGLVVGVFGKGSADLHKLIQSMADSRVSWQQEAFGCANPTKADRSIVVAQIRRRVSVTSVRSQAQCLLERMNHLGESKV